MRRQLKRNPVFLMGASIALDLRFNRQQTQLSEL